MPASSAPSLAQGAEFLARGDFAAAEQVAQAHLARQDDPDALHLLALVRIRQNRLEEALPFLRQACTLRPGRAQLLFNLGKVLAMLGRDSEAETAFQDTVFADPGFLDAWFERGEAQIRLGAPDRAQASFRRVLELEPGNLLARLSLGAALRDDGCEAEAQTILSEGLALADDPRLKAGFAYNLAQCQYALGKKEAALANFTLVRQLEPSQSSVEISRCGLLEELSRFEEAEAGLKALVASEPQNEEAHAAYNDLLYRLRRDQDFLKSYDKAPAIPALQRSKARFLLKTNQPAQAYEIYAGVLKRDPGEHNAAIGAASALNLMARHDEAMALLSTTRLHHPGSPILLQTIAATALQTRDPQKAAAAAEESLKLEPSDHYGLALLGSAWRMMGDERDEVLNGYDELIGTFDLEAPRGFSSMAEFNAALTRELVPMHTAAREPTYQSLRGGSQTRGNLFDEGHALVEGLKERIDEALRAYIAAIRPDAQHPFRSKRAAGYRFRGSWSSRLADCGYHINHIHPEGWISSCYYVGVPDAAKDTEARHGWIKFGEPSMEAGLGPRRAIQPLPGRLVLFPSYMWHGTIPFHDRAARTTIAFDAVPK